MFEYYEDLYRDHPGSPYSVTETEPEVKTCALCNHEAVAIVNNEESFCEEHLQVVVDEFPGSYDEGETLIIRGF